MTHPDVLVQGVCDLLNTIFDDAKQQQDLFCKRIQTFLESRSPNEATLFFFTAGEAIDVDYAVPHDQPGALCFHVTKKKPLEPVSTIHDLLHGTFVSAEVVQSDVEGSAPPEVLDPIVDATNELASSLRLLQTRLPLPLDSFIAHCEEMVTSQSAASAYDSELQRHPVSQLEEYLDRWIGIIEDVLRTFDADRTCEEATGNTGEPLDDIEFWTEKARVLNDIYQQLQGQCIRRILQCIDRAQTTANNYRFAKLCKRLFWARTEAKSNARFLRPLKSFFEKLQNEAELICLPRHFVPIFHLLSLVWKSSDYFTKPRLAGLLKKFCRLVNKMCHRHLSCGLPIEHRSSSEAQEVVCKARDVVRVLGKLKAAFTLYKQKSYSTCPSNLWDVADHVIFTETNRLLGRCHAMIELYITSMQFSVLQGLIFSGGGGRGDMLTAACLEMHNDFVSAFNDLKVATKDFQPCEPNERFESEIYRYKSFVKELDALLKNIICFGVDDCANLDDKLRLLSLLGDMVVERTIIFEVVAPIIEDIAGTFIDEINSLWEIFEQGCSSSSFALHMPPTALLFVWCGGLLSRTRKSMKLLQLLDARLLQGAQCRKLIRCFVGFEGEVSDCQQNEVVRLRDELGDPRRQDMLNAPILERRLVSKVSASTNELSAPLEMFKAMLHPMCERIVLESKYHWLGLGLPLAACNVVDLWTQIRHQYERIAIVLLFANRIQRTIEPLVEPLVRSLIDDLSTILSSGLASSNNAVHWTSMGGLDVLCQRAEGAMQTLVSALTVIQTSRDALDRCIGSVRERVLFEHPPGVLSIADAIEKNRAAAIEIEVSLQNVREATKPHGSAVNAFNMLVKKKFKAAFVHSIELSLEELERSIDGRSSELLSSQPMHSDAIRQWVTLIICADSSFKSPRGPELLSSPRVLSLIAKINCHIENLATTFQPKMRPICLKL